MDKCYSVILTLMRCVILSKLYYLSKPWGILVCFGVLFFCKTEIEPTWNILKRYIFNMCKIYSIEPGLYSELIYYCISSSLCSSIPSGLLASSPSEESIFCWNSLLYRGLINLYQPATIFLTLSLNIFSPHNKLYIEVHGLYSLFSHSSRHSCPMQFRYKYLRSPQKELNENKLYVLVLC